MAVDKMKVFVSWSGGQAQRVAEVWCNLLTDMFDTVQPFMSEQNIGAGERGLFKIAAELEGTSFGIIVVTPENQNSQWLNYEAGALSKGFTDPTVRVAPSLVGFERKSDVTGPLGQFQANLLDAEGVERVLLEVAGAAGVDLEPIPARFRRTWGDYEQRFAEASEKLDQHVQHRSEVELLDEILTTVRSQSTADSVSETLRLVRDMHKVAKFGQAPMERGLRLPLDLPIDEIRDQANAILGEGHDVPITLTCDDDCELIVEIHVGFDPGSQSINLFRLAEAVLPIEGVHGAKLIIDGEPHLPPVYKEWADTQIADLAARREEKGIVVD